MSSGQKKTIIGVVVGVGGAILVGGLAAVAWRFRGRRKNTSDDADDYADLGSSPSGMEKSNSLNGTSPFKSTLDQYHGPGQVNTASNF